MEKFRWWGSSKGEQVQCPVWSSAALKVGSGCPGPPPVQFENLPKMGVQQWQPALKPSHGESSSSSLDCHYCPFAVYLGETRTLFIAVFPLGWLNTICHCIASCLLPLGWLSKPGTFIIPSVLDAAAPWWSYWPSSSYMALGPVCQYLFCAGEPRSGCGAPGVVSQMPNKRLNLFWYTPPGLAQYQVSFSRRKLSPVTHIQLAL